MAESLLVAAAESLIGKLASAAVQQASLVVGVHHYLQQMKGTMDLLKAFLLDADQKKPHSNALKEWLRQINRIFSDADNIVDDFECEALRRHVVNTHGSFSSKVRRFISTSNPLIYRLRMAHQIKDINERLTKVAADGHMFGLQMIHNDTRPVHVREMTHSHVNPSNVVGREHDKQNIIKLLVEDGHDRCLSVIPIVGMGGLGKTTLAKLVFNDTGVDQCFILKMWVCVSNDFGLRNVLIKILNSLPNPANEKFENYETEQLQNRLRNILQSQKFLLVLDDVWNEDRAKWNELKEIIDVGAEGSKILVTTRSHSTAAMMRTKPSSSYPLERLSEEDSFCIFVKLAFEEGEEEKYPHLLEIGKEIVKKCVGIPLAVRSLGSSLFSRVDRTEWESIRDNEIWDLAQNENDILPALEISYNRLPSYLKPCFASFSLFKEDVTISSYDCVNVWQALGFLPPPKERETMNDVANRFLQELLLKSFLVDFVDHGRYYYFNLHDLVHDVAVFVTKGEFQIIYPSSSKIDEHVQHVRIMENVLPDQALVPTCLKTLMFPYKATNVVFLNTMVSRCKYLRILDLENSEYESLPHCIGKLKHLRYLSLINNKKLKELPNSLCELQNLIALKFWGCTKLQKIPKGIGKLISLRQLNITARQPNFPERSIENMTFLEELEFFGCENLDSLFEGIQLARLKSLEINHCGNLKSLSFHAVRNLESLYISDCEKLDMLMGCLGNQIPFSHLKSVGLSYLPQLVTFPRWLQGCMNTLHSLLFYGCENLEELPEWLSTGICLKVLEILDCPKLLSFPDNMHHLTNLERLVVGGCPELSKRCLPGSGQDWHKISHIKKVVIHDTYE
ncbi:hypothetical protein Fmac_020422 [Flemingia macrophylla]|uniref:Uncharacterized protein n=1 Tax=Flemingia macrophylla TaxID=520843 RepID=A0ABD1LU16_9FABA